MCPENMATKKTAIITSVHIVRVMNVCFFFSYSDTGGSSVCDREESGALAGREIYVVGIHLKSSERREVYLLFAYFCFSAQPILCLTTWLRGPLTYFGYTRSPTLWRIIPPVVELDVSSHRALQGRKCNTALNYPQLTQLSPCSSRVCWDSLHFEVGTRPSKRGVAMKS